MQIIPNNDIDVKYESVFNKIEVRDIYGATAIGK